MKEAERSAVRGPITVALNKQVELVSKPHASFHSQIIPSCAANNMVEWLEGFLFLKWFKVLR